MLRKRRPRGASAPERAAEQAGDPQAAFDAGVSLIARRDFCSGELAQKLSARGFEAATVGAALEQLRARRYLDDERYASQFVAYRARRGQGPRRIAQELAELGVPAALVAAAIDEGGDWASLARETRARRFGQPLPQLWPERARQARFLQYRGFSNDHIRAALGSDAITEAD